jgi:DNA modification methylase
MSTPTLSSGAISELAVVDAPVAELRSWERNPRRISPERLEALKRSLEQDREMLRARPLVALTDGRVICGNMRLRAAQQLGWETISTMFVDLDDARARQWVLRDNNSYGEWDDTLPQFLAELGQEGVELELTGFAPEDLDRLIREATRVPRDPDETPPVPATPKSRPGELYELGPHRLLCGDATNPEHVAAVLAGASPFLLLTDPPYGVELNSEWRDQTYNKLGPAGRSYMRSEGHTRTSISGDTKADWSDGFELVPSLTVGYVWHASRFSDEVMIGLKRIGFEPVQQIIWDKQLFAMSRQHYHWRHEPCFYVRKRGAKVPWYGGSKQSTVWEAASPKMIMAGSKEAKVDHPTQKPAVLYTRPIENHLKRGQCFYEPFAGSGTAIVAAEMTGRVCYAVELDPAYCDVIRQRYADFSGQPEYAP